MRKSKLVNALSLVAALSLTFQGQAVSQVQLCSSVTCIHLPFVVRPLPVGIVRLITVEQNRTAYPSVYAEVANSTNETLQTVYMQRILVIHEEPPKLITETVGYSLTVPPSQTMPFGAWSFIPAPPFTRFVSIQVISWTSTLSPTYQPIPIKLIQTSIVRLNQMVVTATIQNTYTQTLTGVRLTLWRFDYSNCCGGNTYGRFGQSVIDVGVLHPEKFFTTTVQWGDLGDTLTQSVRAMAYGIVSP